MSDGLKSALAQVLRRCRNILLHPQDCWLEIEAEPGGLKEAFVPYAVTMELIPSISMLTAGVGISFIFAKAMGTQGGSPILGLAGAAVLSYFMTFLIIALIGKIMSLCAPLFGGRGSWVLACRVLIYSLTPMYVAGALTIIPVLGALVVLLSFPWAEALLYIGIGRVLSVRGIRQVLMTLLTNVMAVMVTMMTLGVFAYFPAKHAKPMGAGSGAHQAIAQSVENSNDTEADKVRESILQQMVASGQLKPSDMAFLKQAMHGDLRAQEEAVKRIEAADQEAAKSHTSSTNE